MIITDLSNTIITADVNVHLIYVMMRQCQFFFDFDANLDSDSCHLKFSHLACHNKLSSSSIQF